MVGLAIGRSRLLVAAKARVDEFPAAWKIRVENEPDRLVRLAQQLREWEAYPRGIERGLPFIMDAVTLRAVRQLLLTTLRGDIDVTVVDS